MKKILLNETLTLFSLVSTNKKTGLIKVKQTNYFILEANSVYS